MASHDYKVKDPELFREIEEFLNLDPYLEMKKIPEVVDLTCYEEQNIIFCTLCKNQNTYVNLHDKFIYCNTCKTNTMHEL